MKQRKCLHILPEDLSRWCRYDAKWEVILHHESIKQEMPYSLPYQIFKLAIKHLIKILPHLKC